MAEPPSVRGDDGEAVFRSGKLPGLVGKGEVELEGQGSEVRSRKLEQAEKRREPAVVEVAEPLLERPACRKRSPLRRKESHLCLNAATRASERR